MEDCNSAAAAGCREALVDAVAAIARRCEGEQAVVGILLSGGVDTAAVLEANLLLARRKICPSLTIAKTFTVFASPAASDRPYAAAVIRRHTLESKSLALDVELKDVLKMVPFCVRTLKTFDPMTLRNAIVTALALHAAKAEGVSVAITGDAADELLGGYSFCWEGADEPLWSEKRDKLIDNSSFSATSMAEALGMEAVSPFLEPIFIAWAKQSANKAACISRDLHIELAPDTERVQHITGKACLRLAFPESPAAFRRKDPIEVGSGSTALRQTDFFSAYFTEAELERCKADYHSREKVRIRDREHLFYYNAFREEFPNDVPDLQRFGSDPCCECGYQLKSPTEMFCRVCGAWPARTTAP